MTEARLAIADRVTPTDLVVSRRLAANLARPMSTRPGKMH